YHLSLHDALPILPEKVGSGRGLRPARTGPAPGPSWSHPSDAQRHGPAHLPHGRLLAPKVGELAAERFEPGATFGLLERPDRRPRLHVPDQIDQRPARLHLEVRRDDFGEGK